jgi:D-alanyl-D-alanine carboxypeptidase (penicillin-binding protein 5/6)
VDLFNAEKAEQSTVAVTAGEQLTERQLLEGLLIPSANNFVEILARSLGTSVDGFVANMNARAVTLRMTHTHFADASGFNAHTVSTAGDLVNLAVEFLSHPTLVQIASLPEAQLPVAGTVFNVDYALGKSGIIGIKTGSSGDAGACFLFAAKQPVGGGSAVIVGAVLGVPTLDAAFESAQKLIQAASLGLTRATVIPAGQRVATYRSPWGSKAGVIPTRDVELLTWPGLLLHRELAIPSAKAPLAGGSAAGQLTAWVGDGLHVEAPLVTEDGLFPPGRIWRITRVEGTR